MTTGRAQGAWTAVVLFVAAAAAALIGSCQRPPGVASGAHDGGPPDGALAACLDQPTDLPRPPGGRLPCELIPPGLVLR